MGKASPDVEIKISDSGEVLFRSPGVFAGYYKDPEKTAEVLTPDGWVHTGDAGFFDRKTGQLKIIDRAKDVGHLKDGTVFAPKYIENKLKFYPNIREAVAVGAGRDFVCAMINIDLTAVGSWAERNNVVYASYQELAAHPRVYDMIARHIDEVNRSLSEEEVMAGAQIRRFLILHKELDPDDGELTRTQKLRRGHIIDRYCPLVEAFYNGSTEAQIATEVTFEDGHKGVIAARVAIRDLKPYPVPRSEDGARGMRAPSSRDAALGEVLLAVEDVSLSFGGVRALTGVSFDIRKGEIRAIIGPNGAGKTSMLNVVNGFYQPQSGRITFKGEVRKGMRPYAAAQGGIARTFQNLALFRGHDDARQHSRRPRAEDAPRIFLAAYCATVRRCRKRSSIGAGSRRSSTFSRSRPSAKSRSGVCLTACRSASSSAARSPWSPICCCSTSRWPA